VTPPELKPLRFLASAHDDLCSFPDEVQKAVGYALYIAQLGGKAPEAKALKGFGGAGVVEIVEDYDGNTYRAVYTVKLRGVVYVLHAFQKKARKGIETPKHDLSLIRARLALAERDYRTRLADGGEEGR
jgi:phage-related protein